MIGYRSQKTFYEFVDSVTFHEKDFKHISSKMLSLISETALTECYKLTSRGFPAVFSLAIWLLFSCGHNRQEFQSIPSADSIRVNRALDFVQPDGSVVASILIEIAETPETQMNRFMGQHALANTQGMLFIFERLTPRKF
jgi:hypothetical protein